MKKTDIFMSIALLMLCECKINNNNSINKMKWMMGTWEHKTANGSIYETWSQASKNELIGKSYKLKNKDTIVFETIRLLQEQDGLFYIPVVKDQNAGSPIRFEGKSISNDRLVFENKTHDFPQVISYLKISDDSLKAEISGVRNGKQERRYFPMRRFN